MLTSIAISKEHAYKFHWSYLSWHSIIVIFILTLHPFYILSWHPLQFWRIIHINVIEYIYLDIELFYLDIQALLSILTLKFFYLSWHQLQFCRCMRINFIENVYLDIKVLVYFILTSIAVLEDHAYKFHRVYLSWHKSHFISYVDIHCSFRGLCI